MAAKYYFSAKNAHQVLDALKRNLPEIEISTDLNLSSGVYEINQNRLVLDSENSLEEDELKRIAQKKGRIFCLENGSTRVLEKRGQDFLKLVPTETAPYLEISGVKMHISKGICPFKSAKMMAQTVVRNKHVVVDTCGGLGYCAIGAVEMGARSVTSYELSDDVISLRKDNPWSVEVESETIAVVKGDVFEHIKNMKSNFVDSVVHDPPRFSLAGDLYSQEFYGHLYRVLKRNGRLFHYTGNPFSAKKGDSFVRTAVKRLKLSGFNFVQKESSLMGIVAQKK